MMAEHDDQDDLIDGVLCSRVVATSPFGVPARPLCVVGRADQGLTCHVGQREPGAVVNQGDRDGALMLPLTVRGLSAFGLPLPWAGQAGVWALASTRW
jgi:hypothetical protein